MQTFLPYPDFTASAEVLDDRRLGKQRIEAAYILRVLYGLRPWKNHPAITMWGGYELALNTYGWHICQQWKDRGHSDTQQELFILYPAFELPPWFGNQEFHLSHRANLARKDESYRALWPDIDITLPYIWPKP